MKRAFVVSFGSLAIAALAACAGVADLDVKYKSDAGSSPAGSSGTLGPGVVVVTDGGQPVLVTPIKDAASIVDPQTLGQAGGACPCDSTQGLACCSSKSGATCALDQSACNVQDGAFLRCFGPDVEGSQCCLHRNGSFSESALAGTCAEGTTILCQFDTECPNGKCTLGTCPGGVSVGTCDGTAVCP